MAIKTRYKLKTGQEVDYFPPIQNTDSPYLTEAAMHADQSNQLEGYGYLVDGVGAFTYLGTVAGSSADYKGFGGGGASVNGQYPDNNAAIAAGLVNGDIYSLPYLYPGGFYPLAIVGNVPNFPNKKSITINSASVQSSYPVYINIFNTAGTDSPNNIYLNGKVRADWGDVRFSDANGYPVPFGIVRKEATFITVAFSADLVFGDSLYFLEYNVPIVSGSIFKMGVSTDQHYDSAETYAGRDQALVRLDNFTTQMITYEPNVILEGGDKTGSVTTTAATRLGFMQSVTDKHNALATTLGVSNYLWGWGNHDFELNTFASVQSQYNGLAGQVSGKLYATWESGEYRFISLDGNYKPADDTHQNLTHVGYGYIDEPQRTWLTDTLNAATKPCIILCHQSLAEYDTLRLQGSAGVTKAQFHVQNRTDVRAILEASGKVAFVLQGHTHTFLNNNINGIPYVAICDLNTPPASLGGWDKPDTNIEGRWNKIELDKGSKRIRVIQEAKVSGVVQTVYDVFVPFGKTIFTNDYGNNAPQTFAHSFTGLYNKSSIAIDASDWYVNDNDWLTIVPASVYNGDPKLSDKTIRFNGITGGANWGRGTFDFATQTGKHKVKFKARVPSTSETFYLNIKGGATIAIYAGFDPNGFIRTNNAGTILDIMTYAANTWYEFEFIIDAAAQTYSFYIDGVLKASGYTFYNSTNIIDKAEWRVDIGTFYVDNFRVEKYVSPTPTITTIGSTQINL